MKSFYVSVDYERFALVHRDEIGLTDTGTICEDEIWNSLNLTLFADNGSTVLGEKTFGSWPDEDVPKEWASKTDVMLIKLEGTVDFEIEQDGKEAEPVVGDFSIFPPKFRSEEMEIIESHGLSSPVICELDSSGYVMTTG